MKEENQSLDKIRLHDRIRAWWYKLFHKDKIVLSQETITPNEQPHEKQCESILAIKYKFDNVRGEYLLQLQRKFEAGLIKEEEMNDDDRMDLEKLYNDQINNLKMRLEEVQKQLSET